MVVVQSQVRDKTRHQLLKSLQPPASPAIRGCRIKTWILQLILLISTFLRILDSSSLCALASETWQKSSELLADWAERASVICHSTRPRLLLPIFPRQIQLLRFRILLCLLRSLRLIALFVPPFHAASNIHPTSHRSNLELHLCRQSGFCQASRVPSLGRPWIRRTRCGCWASWSPCWRPRECGRATRGLRPSCAAPTWPGSREA
mmetsp:Transcript_80123/g.214562  ORF Transcript_80123/g.214562 Transcript_80123/m.214562 type:complete len:205 (+) Transcript_80123:315-929(+)